MNAARSFYTAFALGSGCDPREALAFADHATRAPRHGRYLRAGDLFEDWSNLRHVARVEFALYGTQLQAS